MICKECHREIPDDSLFCEFCGVRVNPEIVEEKQDQPSTAEENANDGVTPEEEIIDLKPETKKDNSKRNKTIRTAVVVVLAIVIVLLIVCVVLHVINTEKKSDRTEPLGTYVGSYNGLERIKFWDDNTYEYYDDAAGVVETGSYRLFISGTIKFMRDYSNINTAEALDFEYNAGKDEIYKDGRAAFVYAGRAGKKNQSIGTENIDDKERDKELTNQPTDSENNKDIQKTQQETNVDNQQSKTNTEAPINKQPIVASENKESNNQTTTVEQIANGTEAEFENLLLKYSTSYGGWEVTGLKSDKISSLNIPESYDGTDIVAIGKLLTTWNTGIKEITFSKNVKYITGTFTYLDGVSQITIAPDNTHFKYENNCLTSADGKTLVAVNKTYTGDLIIPEGVTSIKTSATHNLKAKTIYIPVTVASVDTGAFENTESTKIEVDENNKSFQSIDGVLFSKDGKTLYKYPEKKLGSDYYVPAGTTKIAQEAFRGTNLTNIYVCETVKTIEGYAFTGNKKTLIIHMAVDELPSGFSKNWLEGYSAKDSVKWGESW